MPYPEPRGTKYAYRAISRLEAIFGFRTIGLGHQYPRLQFGLRSGGAPNRGAHTVDAADVKRGKRVLDICGPGMLAAGALERDAEAIGLIFRGRGSRTRSQAGTQWSFSAGRCASPARFRQRASTPCSAATASCTCRNPQRHCVKLRVLRPEGRAALSVWDVTGAGFTLIYEAVRARGSTGCGVAARTRFFPVRIAGAYAGGAGRSGLR